MRGTPFDPSLWRRVLCTALGRRPQYRATNSPLINGYFFVFWCPVVDLSWLSAPGLLWVSFFQVRSRLVSVCVSVPLPVFFPSTAGVAFQLPAEGTSGQVSFVFGLVDKGTDPRTDSFRYPSTYVFLVYLVAPTLLFFFHCALDYCRSTCLLYFTRMCFSELLLLAVMTDYDRSRRPSRYGFVHRACSQIATASLRRTTPHRLARSSMSPQPFIEKYMSPPGSVPQ